MDFTLDLTASYEFSGEWRAASIRDQRYLGTLKLSPSSMSLEVHGDASAINRLKGYSSDKNGLINGTLIDGRKVTLTSAFAIGRPRGAVIAYERILANLCILGAHFPTDESITFDRMHVFLHDFEHWLDYSPFDTCEQSVGDKITKYFATCEIQESLFNFDIENLGKISTAHHFSFREVRDTNLAWNHLPGLEIDSKGGIHKARIERLHYSLSQLFSLLIGEPTAARRITCVNYVNEVSSSEVYICLHDAVGLTQAQVQTSDMLVPYARIAEELPRVFSKWFEKVQIENEVGLRDLFYRAFSEGRTRSVSQFLNYMQVLEAQARDCPRTPLLSRGAFKRLKQQINDLVTSSTDPELSKADPQILDALRKKIDLLNQPVLKTTLARFIGSLPKELVRVFGFDKSFTDKLVDTRHYYTHYGEVTKPIFSGTELMMSVMDRLQWFLVLVQLRSFNIDVDELIQRMKQHPKHKHYFDA